MNYCKLRWSVIVLILAIVISSNYCFGKDDTNNNKGNSIAKDTDNSEVSEKEDHIVTPDQDSNSANSENLDEGEKKEDGDKKEEGDNKEEGEKKEGDKNEDDEKKEGDKNEEGEKKEEVEKKEEGDNKEEGEKKEEGDKKEDGEKKEEDKKEDGEKKEEDKKEDGEKKDGIEKFGENSDIENGIIDNKEDSVEDQENTESQKEEEKKDNGDGEQQDSIHTSIMEGLYKLDYKLKFLRRMLRKDKKMIIQIHALGYLVNTIKEQIVRDVAALNAIVKLEAENASELNKLQSVHDNHVNNRLDFIKHENIVQVNN
ncbi:Uncharacterized protein GY17_00000099 [Cryptosporidium hominis]|uniref:Uncharacterized protein n=4 Tax=Cryptosporidium hominis TaxID=237895 RepID=A0ABX5BGB8_CRYHO|nr:retinitis pigmentosa GTPase regulator [Cryptosporidium hominis TU502]PPS97355.1 Uncharacterized protein GY17_00000099 [Cryptosporidium hominis]|eukprot:PPS97355.1 Uncharacterized protein GY17_00000099 [Cryptosporidium hominis]